MKYENRCILCGKIFQGRNRQQKYCSKKCIQRTYYNRNPQRQTKPCPVCGKLIRNTAKGCLEHTVRNTRRGDKNPNWKGGRYKTEYGYIRVRCPDGKERFEHVLVWQEVNGKTLPDGWIIHHLNGIRDDNRIVNLVAMPDSKHRRLLEAKAKRIQELEALLNGQRQLI